MGKATTESVGAVCSVYMAFQMIPAGVGVCVCVCACVRVDLHLVGHYFDHKGALHHSLVCEREPSFLNRV